MEVTGIILAGGKSRRFGRNKVTEMISGITLIQRVVNRLSPLTDKIVLVINNDGNNIPEINFSQIVADIYPGKGPLGGIYTGLYFSQAAVNVVVAGDMPFLNTGLLKYMIALLPGFDAVIPRWDNNQIEPLHGVYCRSCLQVMKKHLENNQLVISEALKEMNVLYLNEQEFKKLDPEFLSFFNINSQADIERLNIIESRLNQENKH